MKRGKDQDPDEVFEILDIRGSAKDGKNWLHQFLGDITNASAAKQITVGGITGWCTGFVFTKIGKVAATAVGGSLLLLQIAQHQGYVKINWSQLSKDMETASKHLEKHAQKGFSRYLEQGQKFVKENIVLATGFAGGFLIGIASS